MIIFGNNSKYWMLMIIIVEGDIIDGNCYDDCYWWLWFMMTVNDCWWNLRFLLAVADDCWCWWSLNLMMFYDDCWQCLLIMIVNDCWILMMMLSLMLLNDTWSQLRTFSVMKHISYNGKESPGQTQCPKENGSQTGNSRWLV